MVTIDPDKLNKFLDTSGEFSVVQFFDDETYEYVRRHVNAKDAINAFKHYTSSVAVRLGITTRVIIVDELDQINMEWKLDKGVVFPTKEN